MPALGARSGRVVEVQAALVRPHYSMTRWASFAGEAARLGYLLKTGSPTWTSSSKPSTGSRALAPPSTLTSSPALARTQRSDPARPAHPSRAPDRRHHFAPGCQLGDPASPQHVDGTRRASDAQSSFLSAIATPSSPYLSMPSLMPRAPGSSRPPSDRRWPTPSASITTRTGPWSLSQRPPTGSDTTTPIIGDADAASCTTWTRRLLSDEKERLVIAGLGVEGLLT